jgi:cilia- and flagella-associated protein 53
MYMESLDAAQETTIERQAKLREKAKQLKEQKAQHQQALAQEKYEQLWRCVLDDIVS